MSVLINTNPKSSNESSLKIYPPKRSVSSMSLNAHPPRQIGFILGRKGETRKQRNLGPLTCIFLLSIPRNQKSFRGPQKTVWDSPSPQNPLTPIPSICRKLSNSEAFDGYARCLGLAQGLRPNPQRERSPDWLRRSFL